jgi:uridine kinase
MYIVTFIGFNALACLIILRGPQCSGKTEVSQRLRETLDKKHKVRTCLLKLNEINTERYRISIQKILE